MPATHPRCEVIVDALQLACRAPSLHNSQPWRWIATDNTVELFADPARLVRSADSTGREALISCGAVLDHFRVAMSASGWEAAVQRFPDPADPLHLATIEFTPAAVSDQHRRRADAILLRRSDRLPLGPPPGWDDLAGTFEEHTARGGVRVDVVADEFRSSVAEASDLVEALRIHDAEYHSELSWWTAGFVTDEGIPRSSLVSAAESDRVDVGRTFPVVVQAERRTEVDHDQSKILAISTEEDSSRSVLHCGEVLSAVLLDAAAAGLSTCTFSHITEVPTGRDIIASLLPGGGIPQALVRVGLAPSLDATPPPTPRRPVEQVLQLRRGPE
ncbi:Acg family FMN-binding oxidoreductase [Mycolicibacterium hippocampi]|uniref:Putative NAD(P)H nitroreductase acg n=1 Tax=Mycolicibacterium hippocampi TaxID=659824 RepID=A0A7I9ZQ47_9MYCO|nr:NAD(P)H nitroreductase [Mycolicibacterium hippocampi]GFH02827.1 putative NAD(P)H nitroreductase acg [Mycolicibacterium hippocampi]